MRDASTSEGKLTAQTFHFHSFVVLFYSFLNFY